MVLQNTLSDVVHAALANASSFLADQVELSRMQIGDHLKILLDDGEPIDNVPRSVITEGHEIISQERLDDHWQVVIEKKI